MDYPKFVPKNILLKNSIIRFGDTKVSNGGKVYYIYYTRKDLVTKDLTDYIKDFHIFGIFSIKSVDLYYQIFSINYINNSDFYGLLDKLNCIISLDDFSNLVERW